MTPPNPGQPIRAKILYMGKEAWVNGCRDTKAENTVIFDFWSGTGAGTILEWEPRELPNKPDAHPYTQIENRDIQWN